MSESDEFMTTMDTGVRFRSLRAMTRGFAFRLAIADEHWLVVATILEAARAECRATNSDYPLSVFVSASNMMDRQKAPLLKSFFEHAAFALAEMKNN